MKTIHENVFLLGDADLPQSERNQIELHLQDCLDCQEKFNKWQMVAPSLGSQASLETVPFLVQKIMAQVRESGDNSAWRLTKWAAYASVVVILFFLGLPQIIPSDSNDILAMDNEDSVMELAMNTGVLDDDAMLEMTLGEQL